MWTLIWQFSIHVICDQDAYALCRVFKKNTVIAPKIEDNHQYCNVTSSSNQFINSDQSSELNYSEGRCEEPESSNYSMPFDGFQSHLVHKDNSFDMFGGRREGKWSQFLSQDQAFNSTPSFPSYTNIPYPPSKVSIDLG